MLEMESWNPHYHPSFEIGSSWFEIFMDFFFVEVVFK